jgi:hypothetical protein
MYSTPDHPVIYIIYVTYVITRAPYNGFLHQNFAHSGNLYLYYAHQIFFTITKDIGIWRLKVDLEDRFSAECTNKMTMTAEDTETAKIRIAALKEVGGVVDQIMYAIDFEREIKARAIMVILRIKIKGCSTEYNHGETKGTRRKS